MIPEFFAVLGGLYGLNQLPRKTNTLRSTHKDNYKRLCVLLSNEEYACAAFLLQDEVLYLVDKLYAKYPDDAVVKNYYVHYHALLTLVCKHF